MGSNNILLTIDDVLNSYVSKSKGLVALSKYPEWFPVKASPRLAGVIADLMGDGHLQEAPKLRFDYCSSSEIELRRFDNEIFTLFGISGKIRPCTTNKYGTKLAGFNNKPLSRVLTLLGVPSGNKVFRDFDVPDWILQNPDNFAKFVNRLFSCEGSVDVSSKCIDFSMYKSVEVLNQGVPFFNSIKNGLNSHFGIRATNPFFIKKLNVRKDGTCTKGIRLKIKSRQSLINYQNLVGFDDVAKSDKLNKIISSF